MKQKKFSLITSLLLTTAPAAFAASTGTLNLSGTVAVVNDITVTAAAQATTLDIEGGETNLTVASVAETSNNLAGYIITLSSANAGELINGSDVSKKTSYQISYDGGSMITPPNSTAPVTVKTVNSLTGLTTNTSDVKVNVSAYNNAPAGTYSDTVTLSIVAN